MDIQPTVTDMQTMCEDFVNRSIFAKTEMCKEESMSDNPPMLLIGFATDPTDDDYEDALAFQQENNTSKPYKVALLPLMHRDDPIECISDVVKHLNPRPFSFVALVAEGYYRDMSKQGKTDDILANYEKGDMEKDYKENPFTDVREAIVVTAVDWNCEHLYSAYSPYRYDDNGVPMFDNTAPSFAPLNGLEWCRANMENIELGRVPTALVSFVLFMHFAIEATRFTSKFTDAPKRNKDDE